jgi:hypothetical protein
LKTDTLEKRPSKSIAVSVDLESGELRWIALIVEKLRDKWIESFHS